MYNYTYLAVYLGHPWSMYTVFVVYLGSLYSTDRISRHFICSTYKIDAIYRQCHSNLRYVACLGQGDVGGSAIRSGLATWHWWESAIHGGRFRCSDNNHLEIHIIWRSVDAKIYLVSHSTFFVQSSFIIMFFEICADVTKKDRQRWTYLEGNAENGNGLAPAPTVNHVSQVSKRKSWGAYYSGMDFEWFWVGHTFEASKIHQNASTKVGESRFEQVQHHVVASENADRVLVELTPAKVVGKRNTSHHDIQRLTTSLFKTSSKNGQRKRAKLCPQVYGEIQLWVWSHTKSVGVGPIWSNIYI